MDLTSAQIIAQDVLEQLKPHCTNIQIAGSIRRQAKHVKDIEIVAIPKPYQTGLFESGIATIVNQWTPVKGALPCKYTQRLLPQGIKLDLFFATPLNWGLILAIRTGSSEFSHTILAKKWCKLGYRSENGMLMHGNKQIAVPTEQDLFTRLGITWVEPTDRNL